MKKLFYFFFVLALTVTSQAFSWDDEYRGRDDRSNRYRRTTQRKQNRTAGCDRRAFCNDCCAQGEWVSDECLQKCNRCFERNDSAVTAGRYWPHA